MVRTIAQFLLFRFLPRRLVPFLLLYDAYRFVQRVRPRPRPRPASNPVPSDRRGVRARVGR
jgi:hypothetical protein